MLKICLPARILKAKHAIAGKKIFLMLPALAFVLISCSHPAGHRVSQVPSEERHASLKPITDIYFYPKSGQSPERQDRDRYECFNWAVKQTGFDPNLVSVPQEYRVSVVPVPPPGHDTAVGAVAGAMIGAVAAGPRHAPGGALVGAAVGALAGAASDSARQESARSIEEGYARRDRDHFARLERKAMDYRRAMTACLEGRGYAVR
ncbi:MAG TPA: glycine zipper 2TM domain-containing protein [Syntrophales bacterium]|nr:glycine zipper 2TM domain-containing protein [Syntrophales bacterium]